MFWINALRIVVGLASVLSFSIMFFSFAKNRNGWNTKTRDYWYGRMIWTLVGLSAAIEGLIRNSPFRYTFLLTAVAVLVTLKGNLQKGKWGTDSEEEDDEEDADK